MSSSIVEEICKWEKAPEWKLERAPVYMHDAYVSLLCRSYAEAGLDPPTFIDDIPIKSEPAPKPRAPAEPDIGSPHKVHLRVKYDDDGDCVHCSIASKFADMYTEYYDQSKKPPLHVVVQAYKELGFSDEFLKSIITKHDIMEKRYEKLDLDKIFGAEKKKKKKEKAPPKPPTEQDEDIEVEEEEEVESDHEDECFDMEANDDDDEEAIEEDFDEGGADED